MTRARDLGAFLLCFALAGCSGYRSYDRSSPGDWPPVDGDGAPIIKSGSSVRAHTADGLDVEGKVESVDAIAFVVDGQPLPYNQVEVLQVRSFLVAPTAALAAGVGVLGALLMTSAGTFETHGD